MWRKTMSKFVYIAVAAGLVLGILAGCGTSSAGNAPVSRSALLLDTVVTVTLYGGEEALIEECFHKCREYELIFSRTHPDSELYALNATGSMEVSEDLLRVIRAALEYCRVSNGAFDITMGGVSELYAFSSDDPRVPEGGELAEAVSHVGYENVLVEGNRVTLRDPEAVLDLGAIAKGYIADRLAEFLREQGVESALIDLGGNILCVGSKPGGSAYRVGLQYPFRERKETIAVVEVRDLSVVTSGVYERSFEEGGVLYHHILDPDTGLPVKSDLLAVSILSPRSVDGDALSTVCFALGLEKGLELINSLEGVYAAFVTEDMQLHYSAGFEDFIR